MLDLHEKRRCKCTEHRGDEAWHGIVHKGYRYHYCRCRICRASNRDASRAEYAATPERRRAQGRVYYSKNREVMNAKRRARGRAPGVDRAYREANPAAIRARAEAKRTARLLVDARASRSGERWTRAEDLMVTRSGMRDVEIAAALSRTVWGVTGRRRNLKSKG